MSIIKNFQKVKYQLNIMLSSTNDKIKEFYETFTSHHNGDSGIDLYNDELLVESFLVGTIDFQIKCEMIDLDTNQYTSYYLVPRSSLAKTPFQLANSIGIIDAGYRGNLMAKIRNFTPNKSELLSNGSYFQVIAPDLKLIKVNIVNELSTTTRDVGGFGSTNSTSIYTLYFDGCCKGNPGQGGSGAVIYDKSKIIWSDSLLLGDTTNNRAEYNGLILGLTEAKKRGIKDLIVKGDSKLVIEQMSGKYKVRSKHLELLYNSAKNIISEFNTVTFIHIKRTENKYADKMANDSLK